MKRVIAAAIIAASFTWALQEWGKPLPGMSVVAFVRLYDTPESRRRYVFEAQTSEGAKASFYLSASGIFMFSVTDLHGEPYFLEIPIGNEGIPIDRYIFLYCGIGVSGTETSMEVLVDGKQRKERTLPFPIELGNTTSWKQNTIGANNQGTNNAPFKIALFGLGQATMASWEIRRFNDQFIEFLRAINSPISPK